MPLYFIDTDDGDKRVSDMIGVELAGPAEARLAVLDVLPDMAREKMPDGDRRTFRAMARGQDGKLIYRATMTLSGVWD